MLRFTLLFFTQKIVAQNQTDPIESYQVLGTVYAQNGKKLNVRKLLAITKNNAAAYDLMKKAQGNNTIGSVIGGVGGFLLGWQLGAALGGGEPNWTVGGVGAGLIAVSVPFSIKFGRQTKEAVSIYNESLQGISMRRPKLMLNIQPTAVGIALRF